MKKILVTAVIAALSCAVALAQTTTQSPTEQSPNTSQAPATAPATQAPATQAPNGLTAQTQTSSSPRIAPGSVVPVRLTKSIDAKKAKPGDEVLATVTVDLKTNSGEVIVPKDTKVVGHVTEAQARNKEQKESEVGIAFDKAVSKTGDMNMPMSIQAIIVPPNPAENSVEGSGQSAAGGAPTTSPMGNRNAPMEGSPRAASPNAVPTTGMDSQTDNNPRPQITGNTHGVIGMPDVKLEETTQNATQGSVVTSEKGNVKLESGTLMLLRVNQ